MRRTSLQSLTGATGRARTWAVPWALVGYLALGLVALLPRVLDLGLFFTLDEASFWLRRSEAFLKAIQRGHWDDTAISTHPGVTTMWLGAAGIVVRRTLSESGWLTSDTFATTLALMRLPAALAHTAAILVGYRLLRRMLTAPAAFGAALFWATDPFVIAYSRLLHVDALAGSFATVSLLAACVYWHHGVTGHGSEVGRSHYASLILSGVAAGLAILSKSPALALVPVVAFVAARGQGSGVRGQKPATITTNTSPPLLLAPSPLHLVIWLAVVALTVFALYPALWVAPLEALARVRAGVEIEGAEPHMLGNFFLGQPQDAPGALYYPVVLALQPTPWVLAGLLLAPLAWRHIRTANRRDLAALALFALVFVAALTLFPKKFHRYMVPAFPALDIIAAVAIYNVRLTMYDYVKRIGYYVVRILPVVLRPSSFVLRPGFVLCSVFFVVCTANVARYHPYEIAYYNPLFGGARTGAQTFLIGWGEGMDQVAAWLNAQPDITGVRTVSTTTNILQPFMQKGAQIEDDDDGKLPKKTGYVVIYVRRVQRGAPSAPYDAFYKRQEPAHVVRIHGVEYAWIYRVPVN